MVMPLVTLYCPWELVPSLTRKVPLACWTTDSAARGALILRLPPLNTILAGTTRSSNASRRRGRRRDFMETSQDRVRIRVRPSWSRRGLRAGYFHPDMNIVLEKQTRRMQLYQAYN